MNLNFEIRLLNCFVLYYRKKKKAIRPPQDKKIQPDSYLLPTRRSLSMSAS